MVEEDLNIEKSVLVSDGTERKGIGQTTASFKYRDKMQVLKTLKVLKYCQSDRIN